MIKEMNTIAKDHDEKTMWGLILLAIFVDALFHFLRTLTGNNEIDGLVSVLLGLYICSKPATHVVDMMIFGRDIHHWISTIESNIWWVLLNLLVMLSGLSSSSRERRGTSAAADKFSVRCIIAEDS